MLLVRRRCQAALAQRCAHNKASSSTSNGSDTSSLSASVAHCQQLVRQHDYEGYLCTLLLPVAARHTCLVVRAVNVELSQLRDQVQRWSGSAEAFRLQFWADVVDGVFGVKNNPLPRQPIMAALRSLSDQSWLHPLLMRLVSARRRTLGDRPYENIDAIYEYGWDTHGALLQTALSSVSRSSTDHPVITSDLLDSRVKHLASAMALVQLCRSCLPLLNKGVWLLPDSLMDEFGCDLHKICRGGGQPTELRALGLYLDGLIGEHLTSVTANASQVPRPLRVPLLPAAGVRAFRRRFRAVDYNVLAGRLTFAYPSLAPRLYANRMMGRF